MLSCICHAFQLRLASKDELRLFVRLLEQPMGLSIRYEGPSAVALFGGSEKRSRETQKTCAELETTLPNQAVTPHGCVRCSAPRRWALAGGERNHRYTQYVAHDWLIFPDVLAQSLETFPFQ